MKKIIFIFAGIGLLLLTNSGYLYNTERQFLNHAQLGNGTVIELHQNVDSKGSVTYYPRVRYITANGQEVEFSSTVGSNPASYDVGEAVEVYYEPKSPQNAEIKGFFTQWLGVLITGVLGLMFSAIGIGMGVWSFNRKKRNEWLTRNGTRIQALVQNVELNTSLEINGKSPFVIYGQWLNPRTNQVHLFESESIWYNPTNYLSSNNIPVFIDERNPKSYYMDISFLPKVG